MPLNTFSPLGGASAVGIAPGMWSPQPPQNALLPSGGEWQRSNAANPSPAQQPANPLSPVLVGAISHAAHLSDTPEKWASTLDMLKSHGIDPTGYEDFHEGRPLAIAGAALSPDAPGPLSEAR